MEVVITDQSLTRLEESLHFYTTELEMPVDKAIEIKDALLLRARPAGKTSTLHVASAAMQLLTRMSGRSSPLIVLTR